VGANSTIALGRWARRPSSGTSKGEGLSQSREANDTDARVILTGNALHADGVNLPVGPPPRPARTSRSGNGPLTINGPGAASLGNVFLTNIVLSNEIILSKDLSIGSPTGSMRINGQAVVGRILIWGRRHGR
jgi:hypothetical protein